MIWFTSSEVEEAAENLLPKERGLVLYRIGNDVLVPEYWKEPNAYEWLRLYGRRLLGRWYAEEENKKAIFDKTIGEDSMWDFFHGKIRVGPKPWWMNSPYFWLNQRGLLMRQNEKYCEVFPNLYRPEQGFKHLRPQRQENTWIVEGNNLTTDPDLFQRLGLLPQECKRPSYSRRNVVEVDLGF